MDLSKLSIKELQNLLHKIPAELKKRDAKDKNRVLDEVKALAKSRGYSLDDLIDGAPRKTRAGGVVPQKFRHPENADLQWTGRGRKPKWVESWLNGGGNLDALRI